MSNVNPEFVERFQLEYQKNPRSRVFASLAEAYRKMGLVDEANRLCIKGVQIHPGFAGGRVAYAKVLLDLKQLEKALEQLEKAVEISPENLLAHSLLGEVLLNLRRPKDALKAYKMVLFLNPNDEKAKAAVGKWEFLSADEYEDELFSMQPVFALEKNRAPVLNPIAHQAAAPTAMDLGNARTLERAVSLADAFTVRGEPEKALAVLQEVRNRVGSNAEVDRRFELLARRARALYSEPEVESTLPDEADEPEEYEELVMPASPDEVDISEHSAAPIHRVSANYGVDPREKIRLKLETFLRRIEARRLGG